MDALTSPSAQQPGSLPSKVPGEAPEVPEASAVRMPAMASAPTPSQPQPTAQMSQAPAEQDPFADPFAGAISAPAPETRSHMTLFGNLEFKKDNTTGAYVYRKPGEKSFQLVQGNPALQEYLHAEQKIIEDVLPTVATVGAGLVPGGGLLAGVGRVAMAASGAYGGANLTETLMHDRLGFLRDVNQTSKPNPFQQAISAGAGQGIGEVAGFLAGAYAKHAAEKAAGYNMAQETLQSPAAMEMQGAADSSGVSVTSGDILANSDTGGAYIAARNMAKNGGMGPTVQDVLSKQSVAQMQQLDAAMEKIMNTYAPGVNLDKLTIARRNVTDTGRTGGNFVSDAREAMNQELAMNRQAWRDMYNSPGVLRNGARPQISGDEALAAFEQHLANAFRPYSGGQSLLDSSGKLRYDVLNNIAHSPSGVDREGMKELLDIMDSVRNHVYPQSKLGELASPIKTETSVAALGPAQSPVAAEVAQGKFSTEAGQANTGLFQGAAAVPQEVTEMGTQPAFNVTSTAPAMGGDAKQVLDAIDANISMAQAKGDSDTAYKLARQRAEYVNRYHSARALMPAQAGQVSHEMDPEFLFSIVDRLQEAGFSAGKRGQSAWAGMMRQVSHDLRGMENQLLTDTAVRAGKPELAQAFMQTKKKFAMSVEAMDQLEGLVDANLDNIAAIVPRMDTQKLRTVLDVAFNDTQKKELAGTVIDNIRKEAISKSPITGAVEGLNAEQVLKNSLLDKANREKLTLLIGDDGVAALDKALKIGTTLERASSSKSMSDQALGTLQTKALSEMAHKLIYVIPGRSLRGLSSALLGVGNRGELFEIGQLARIDGAIKLAEAARTQTGRAAMAEKVADISRKAPAALSGLGLMRDAFRLGTAGYAGDRR